MTALEVNFVKLAECLVSPGWQLAMDASDAPAIHYNLGGTGRMIVGTQPPIELLPHTLVIVPRGQAFLIEVQAERKSTAIAGTVEGKLQQFAPDRLRKFIAGDGEPRLMLICGYFNASFGASIDLFAAQHSVIVEQFDADDQLDHKLKSALAELIAQEVGMGAMTTALMKQVLVTLLRRSLTSTNLWVERFSMLGDPQIARAFAAMTARPGASHSISALSQAVGLSRSAFMARFTAAFGQSPMAVLRQLRMRHAAMLLANDTLSIDQIAHEVGYASRSSFTRAFKKIYRNEPPDHQGKPYPFGTRLPRAMS